MSISVFIRLGVSAGIPLQFNTINTIKTLVDKHSAFIYGIDSKPVDYDERPDCFDIGILDLLSIVKSEEEFKMKLACIAELRKDDDVLCLRRKKEYVTSQDYSNYKRFIMDDDDNDGVEYNVFDCSELWFEFFQHCSSLDADFDDDRKSSYGTIGSVHNFLERINESVDYFKTFGIEEENIDITHYNVVTI